MTRVLRDVCELEIEQPQLPDAPPAEPITFIKLVADKLVQFIRELLLRYPLIIQTDLLKKCAAADTTQDVFGDALETEDIMNLVEQLFNAKYQDLFHVILMHNKYSITQLREEVARISQVATSLDKTVKAKNPAASITTVVFIDEFNTTSLMGSIKEILMDHSLDGEPLPDNIFWVAAMNPPVEANDRETAIKHGISAAFSEKNNFAGVASSNQVFTVRHIPQSLEELVLHFKVFVLYM